MRVVIAWLVLNGGVVFVAAALAVTAGYAARPGHLVLATLSGYLVVVHSLVLGAGLLGHLTAAGLGLLLSVPVAAALWLVRRGAPDHGGPDRGRSLTPIALLVSLAAGGMFGVWAWPHLVQAIRLWVWDDYTYHMVYPALWLRRARDRRADPAAGVHDAGVVSAVGQRRRHVVHDAAAGIPR